MEGAILDSITCSATAEPLMIAISESRSRSLRKILQVKLNVLAEINAVRCTL